MLQVINANGDNDISSVEEKQAHFISTCLTLHRYFRQNGAKGFVADMSSLVYYLREQTYGSCCFLQAACIVMCYMLQSFGTFHPPVDGSRLIRHHFTDEQLYNYIVTDKGGDSVAILRILDNLFLDCDFQSRPIASISCHTQMEYLAYALELIGDGPGLVSKFLVPQNCVCV
eukprot:scaffold48685_cov46-Attheya_sp.AAC.3